MLQELNQRFRGMVAWFVVIVIGVTLVLFGVQQYRESRQSTDALATVNGNPIPRHEFFQIYQQMYGQVVVNRSDAEQIPLKNKLLDDLIVHQVSAYSARALGFTVAKAQIDAAIVDLPYFQERGEFSPTRYQSVLAANHLTHRQFQHRLAEELITNQLRFAVTETEFALPNELDSYARSDFETRSYRYVQISSKQLLSTVPVTLAELEAYFAKHRLEFVIPEQVRVEYLTLSLADFKARIHPSEQQLRDYYQVNQSNFTTQSGKVRAFSVVKKQLAEQWVNEKAQTDYTAAVDQLTDWSYQHPDSLQAAAEQLALPIQTTDWFTRAGEATGVTHDTAFLKAAFSDEVFNQGNNSAPVALDNGQVVVLRVREQQLAQEQPLSVVQPTVEKKLRQEKAQLASAKLGQQLISVSPLEREQLLEAHHLHWTTIVQSSRQVQAIKEPTSVHQLAFAMAPRLGQLKGQAQPNGYTVVELQQVTPGKLEALGKPQREALGRRLTAEQGIANYEAYVKHQVALARIVKL